MQHLYQKLLQKLNLPRSVKFVFVLGILSALFLQKADAQTTTVVTTLDVVDGNTSSIAALNASPGPSGVSLREACMAATNDAGTNITININAGTYSLTIVGTDNTGAAGDLDLNHGPTVGTKTITLNGADSSTTIIQQTIADRILEISAIGNAASLTVNINRLRFQNGNINNNGGAIYAGEPLDITNITDCAFNNNTCTNTGGAVSHAFGSATHHLTILNSTFMNNSVSGAGDGGAVYFNGLGNLTITNCKFIGNTVATGDGGAVGTAGNGTGGTHTIQRSQFILNRATAGVAGTSGRGGAIANAGGDINAIYNRFFGNTVAIAGNGNTLAQDLAVAGNIITATDNWWGVNTGAVAADIFTLAGATAPVTTPYLQLKASASPTTICINAASTITATFLSNSAGSAIAPANLTAMVGLPVSFSATLGALSGAQATIQASGTATVTYTAGGTSGTGTVNAVVDNVPTNDLVARASLTINPGPTITANPSNSTTCLGLASTFTATASNATSTVWQESTNPTFTTPTTLTNTGIYSGVTTNTLTISDNSTVDGRYYRLLATNTCGPIPSTGAQLLATAPTLPSALTTTVTQSINTNNNLYYAPGCLITTRIIPGTITGSVTTQVWRQVAVPTYGGKPYVQRHYQITPAVSPGTATATVTLYFTQTEFDNFNAHAGSTANLPLNSGDNAGKLNLRVAKYAGSSGDGSGTPGSYSAGAIIIDPLESDIVFNTPLNRWEVTIPVTGFSGFIVQTSLVVLPVNLLSFTGQLANNDIRLNWKTGGETENDHFEVERSLDGRNYTAIGQRPGSNGNTVRDYDLTDAGAALLTNSKLFYRLKIVSVTGRIEYSNIVVIHLTNKGMFVTGILPNPFAGELNISINALKSGKMGITVVDMAGRVLIKQQSPVTKGFSTQPVSGVEKLGAGVYTLLVSFDGETSTHKIVKQ